MTAGFSAALASLLFAGLSVSADRANPEPPPQTFELTRTQSGHLATLAQVDALTDLPFIVDTGASHSAIAQSLAEELGGQGEGTRRDVQALTELFGADAMVLNEILAFGLGRRNVPVVIIETPPEAQLSAAGLLGRNFLDGQTVTLDIARQTLTLEEPARGPVDGFISQDWGVPFAAARVSALPGGARVLIDTGAARTIVNHRFARRMTRERSTLSTRVGGVSGRMHRDQPAESVYMHRLRIGGYCRSRAAVLVADLDIFEALGWNDEPAMVLGLDLLESARIQIDYAAGTVSLDPADGASNLGCIGTRADAQWTSANTNPSSG